MSDTRLDLPLASAGSDMIRWSRVLLSHTPNFFWGGVTNGLNFFLKYQANEDFPEPPHRADPNNTIFTLTEVWGRGVISVGMWGLIPPPPPMFMKGGSGGVPPFLVWAGGYQQGRTPRPLINGDATRTSQPPHRHVLSHSAVRRA